MRNDDHSLEGRTPGVGTLFHRPLHAATVLTTILVFPLVWMGGLVTSKGAGMSVPDWPNSYGYNMFALPFNLWIGRYAGGTFYEHSHRLLGTLVGLSAFTATMLAWAPSRQHRWRRIWGGTAVVAGICFLITLGVALWLRQGGRVGEDAYKTWTHVFSGFGGVAISAMIAWRCWGHRDVVRWRRWAITSVLIAVCVQGAFGGKRVTDVSLLLAEIHGILGQLVFAGAAGVAVTTSRWWGRASLASSAGSYIRPLAVAAISLVFVQLLLGATMRHDPDRTAATGGGGAGLAIPDWPLHYSVILPPTTNAGLIAANADRVWNRNLPPTTLHAVWLHFAHRLGAYTTAIVLLCLAAHAWRRHRATAAILSPAMALGILVIAQVTLGVLTVLKRKPADIATAHQATGALLLMTATVLLVRVLRLYPFGVRRRVEDGFETPRTDAVAATNLRPASRAPIHPRA